MNLYRSLENVSENLKVKIFLTFTELLNVID